MIQLAELLDALERELASRLQPSHVPPADAVWDSVQGRLRPRRARRLWRRVGVLAGMVVLMLLAVAGVLMWRTGACLGC